MKYVFAFFALFLLCSPSTETVYVLPATTSVIVSVSPSVYVCDYVWVYDENGVQDIMMKGHVDTLQVSGDWVGLRYCTRCGDPSYYVDTLYQVRAGLVVEVK